MAGKGTISVNQQPQYGDKTAIDRLKKTMTATPMTGNAAPAPTAGRPPTGGQQQSQGPPAQGGLPQGHIEAADDVARKAWAAKFWAEQAAQPTAGPKTRMYAAAAQKALSASMRSARNRTPYFE